MSTIRHLLWKKSRIVVEIYSFEIDTLRVEGTENRARGRWWIDREAARKIAPKIRTVGSMSGPRDILNFRLITSHWIIFLST